MSTSPNLTKGTCHKCGERCFRISYVGNRLVCVNCFEQTVFACRPCECGGMCDKCRQTERAGMSHGGSPDASAAPVVASETLTRGVPARSVCLCDPDTDAVCDRNCGYDKHEEGWETRRGPTTVGGDSGDGQVSAARDARSTPKPGLTIRGRVSEPSPSDAVCDRNCP